MKMQGISQNSRGFSLLEVLVAVIVFAVGLLAIASLQGSLMRSGSEAKARTVAGNLAEDQIEEARSFAQVADFGNIVSAAPETIVESGVEFRREMTVQDYFYQRSAGDITLTPVGDPTVNPPEVKMVTVSVTWCDAESGPNCDPADPNTEPHEVMVEDVVGLSASPIGSARTLTQLNASTPPRVPYRPGDAPSVISIDLGDGSKKESPEPTLQTTRSGSQDSEAENVNTITRLSAITYNTLASGEVTIQRQEFVAANCTCRQAGVPSSESAYGFTPLVWDGDDWVGRKQVAKPVGTSTLGSSAGSQLRTLCNDCCRDHHDAPANTTFEYDVDGDGDIEAGEEVDVAKYDPFRNEASPLGSGDHHHYNGRFELADSVGAVYLEACRFARVDGNLELTSDFRLESFQVLPALSSAAASDADQPFQNWIDGYREYVEDFVVAYGTAVADDTVDYPTETPLTDDPDTGAADDGPLPTAEESPYNLPTTDAFNNSNETRELVARAIYIDFIHPILESRIECRLGLGSASNCREADTDDGSGNLPPVLPIMPFYEANVALQANWNTAGGNWVFVTDEPVANDGNYSRGVATRNTRGSGETLVGATIEQGNVGLTDSHEILPFDCNSFAGLSIDGLRYNTGGGSPNPLVSRGCIKIEPSLIEGNKVNPSDVIVRNGLGEECGSLLGDNFYQCNINSDGSGTIVVTGYSRNSNNNNKVCLETSPGNYDGGVVTNDATRDDTTTFTLTAINPPEDRVHTLFVVPQNGGAVNCTPAIQN